MNLTSLEKSKWDSNELVEKDQQLWLCGCYPDWTKLNGDTKKASSGLLVRVRSLLVQERLTFVPKTVDFFRPTQL